MYRLSRPRYVRFSDYQPTKPEGFCFELLLREVRCAAQACRSCAAWQPACASQPVPTYLLVVCACCP